MINNCKKNLPKYGLHQRFKLLRKKRFDVSQGLTCGGSILTFGFNLVTFDPLLNISLSLKSFGTLKHLASLHKNNFLLRKYILSNGQLLIQSAQTGLPNTRKRRPASPPAGLSQCHALARWHIILHSIFFVWCMYCADMFSTYPEFLKEKVCIMTDFQPYLGVF